MSPEEEEAGADLTEHNIEHYSPSENRRFSAGVSTALHTLTI